MQYNWASHKQYVSYHLGTQLLSRVQNQPISTAFDCLLKDYPILHLIKKKITLDEQFGGYGGSIVSQLIDKCSIEFQERSTFFVFLTSQTYSFF